MCATGGTVDDISQPARIVVTDASVLINLIHVDRLDLLGALPGFEFVVPPEVESEVAKHKHLLAIGTDNLRRKRFQTTAELQRYAQHVRVLGKGEAACLAMAEVHGWSIASDERGKLLKLSRLRLGAGRILNTPGVFIIAIRANLITVEEADHDKRILASRRFEMRFSSFGEFQIPANE